MAERIFCLLSKQDQKQDKKLEIQLFLTYLLVPLALADQSCFSLVLEVSALSLTIGFAISRAEFISEKIAVGFSKWFQ